MNRSKCNTRKKAVTWSNIELNTTQDRRKFTELCSNCVLERIKEPKLTNSTTKFMHLPWTCESNTVVHLSKPGYLILYETPLICYHCVVCGNHAGNITQIEKCFIQPFSTAPLLPVCTNCEK